MVVLTSLSGTLISGVQKKMCEIIKEKWSLQVAHAVFCRFTKTETEWKRLLRGEVSEKDYWKFFLSEAEWPFEVSDLENLVSSSLVDEIPFTRQAFEEIVSYPEHLSSTPAIVKGRPEIYIVSDHIKERATELVAMHINTFAMAAKTIWSFELGMVKSDPSYWPRLLEEINKEPYEILFIDNSMDNIQMARYAGVHSILFKDAFTLGEEMQMYNFSFY